MIPLLNSATDLAKEYGNWLQSFHWDLFGTLTFDLSRSSHSEASRKQLLSRYLNSMERNYKRKIRCFWAEEKSWSGCGAPAIAPHFHVLLACDRNSLSPEYPKELWQSLAGRADMQVYDPTRDGAIYCAKYISTPDANYDFFHFSLPPGLVAGNAALQQGHEDHKYIGDKHNVIITNERTEVH